MPPMPMQNGAGLQQPMVPQPQPQHHPIDLTDEAQPPKVWRLRWGTFLHSKLDKKDFTERFKGLRGFISWYSSDPWDGSVFVEFSN